ncbi:MAG: anti-sigma factor [Pirellulaceae bacterium]
MLCTEMRELLSGYLDGELSGQLEDGVARHLEGCAPCSEELVAFSAISGLANSLPTPVPPPEVWDGLERELDKKPQVEVAPPRSRGAWGTYRLFAVAATLLVAAGVFTWLARPFGGGDHQMAHFGRFVQAFHVDPEAAQQTLLANYSGRAATAPELSDSLQYTPVGLGNAPTGYAIEQSYLLNMPCCRCSQVVFRRNQGGLVALFEHDTSEQSDLFGNGPCVKTQCNGNPCTLVQTDNHIAALCEVGGRHFTIVGARNVEEVQAFVAWLEGETQAKTSNS